MRNYLFIFFAGLLFACSGNKSNIDSIRIDLKENVSSLHYSLFSDSVSYLTLEMNDNNLFISKVKKVYLDDGFIFLEDNRRGGIFVFSQHEGSFVANLNYFGQGPGEFIDIRTFTLDTEKKQVVIFSYPFLHKYTYDGLFIETINTNGANLNDFYHLTTGEYICITPEEMEQSEYEGVWLADSSLKYIKTLKQIPSQQKLFVRSTFHNGVKNGIYYYDPIWEDFSYINRDSTDLLYKFDFKQRVPEEQRTKEISDYIKELNDYSFVSSFTHSTSYLLLNYFNFDGSPSFWILMNKRRGETMISKHLENDLNKNLITTGQIFYIDNQTWCRFSEIEEDNLNITIEFIHVKN